MNEGGTACIRENMQAGGHVWGRTCGKAGRVTSPGTGSQSESVSPHGPCMGENSLPMAVLHHTEGRSYYESPQKHCVFKSHWLNTLIPKHQSWIGWGAGQENKNLRIGEGWSRQLGEKIVKGISRGRMVSAGAAAGGTGAGEGGVPGREGVGDHGHIGCGGMRKSISQ